MFTCTELLTLFDFVYQINLLLLWIDLVPIVYLQGKFHSFHPVATILSYLTKAPLVSSTLSGFVRLSLYHQTFCVHR